MRILLIVCIGLLSGCVSPEVMEANKKQHCANMGAPEGSVHYYQCRQTLEAQIERSREQDLRNIRENLRPMSQPVQPITLPPRFGGTQCYSRAEIGGVRTTCD
jgi:hypothetical protein